MLAMVKIQRVTNPGGIEGVTEEFMVQLARVLKDAQADKKCCYHGSSPEHFICNCPLMKPARDKKQLNGKEGTANNEGSPDPSDYNEHHQEAPRRRLREA